MSDTATVTLLGYFSLLVDGRSVSLPGKGVELVAFLALQPSRRASRRRLSGVLWPDLPHERALGNLNTTLWRIRNAVREATPSELIETTRTAISLNKSKLRVDYWLFEECTAFVAKGDVDPSFAIQAVDLYKGDLLDGEIDSEWLFAERERLRRLYLQALRSRAQHQTVTGNPSEALHSYELALEVDPLNEEVYREVMKLHCAEGRRTEALRVFHSLKQRLRTELQIDPEIETVKLSETIGESRLVRGREPDVNRSGGLVHTTTSQIEIVGREHELTFLHDALAGLVEGRPVLIGVEGEIGIGKTKLVVEFGRSATSRGCKVMYGRCREFPQASPYSVLRELFASVPGVWAELESSLVGRRLNVPLPLHPGVPAWKFPIVGEDRRKILDAIVARLRDLIRREPLVLLLEDVQFADRASLDLILSLLDYMRTNKLLLVMSWRNGDCPGLVSPLLTSPSGFRKVLRLSRLDSWSVRALCQGYFWPSHPPNRVVHFVYSQSEGNPLFALECLRSLQSPNQPQEDRMISHKDPGFGSGRPDQTYQHGAVPVGIRAYVVGRMQKLPEKVRQVLRVAASSGREVDPIFITRVLNVPLDRVLRRLNLLLSAGFVLVNQEKFEFVHDKIRELCYEEMSVPVKLRTHRRIHDVLKVQYPDRLDALAFHSGRAGRSDQAVSYWGLLGDRAANMWAYSDACAAYSAALDSLERNGGEQQHRMFALLKKRALAREHLGELEEGAADVRKLREIAVDANDEQKKCDALMLESRFLLRRGSFGRSLDYARIAVDMAHQLGDRSLEVHSREVAALAMARLGDYEHAEQELLRLKDVLELESDAEGLERVWNNLGRVQVVQGRNVQALKSLENAEQYATGELHEKAMRGFVRALARGYMARGEEALVDLHQAEKDFARVGSSSGQAIANAWLSFYYVCKGDLKSGVIHGRRGLPFKAGRTDTRWAWMSASILSFGLWFNLGNYGRAQKEIAIALEAQSGKGNKGNFLDTAAAIALEQGQLDTALALARDAAERLLGEANGIVAECLTTVARIYLALGRPGEAVGPLRRAAALQEEAFEQLNLPRTMAFLAIAEKDLGLMTEALEHSRRAAELLSQNGEFAYLPQDVYWNHFQVLQAAGDPAAADALRKAYRLVMRLAGQLGRKGRARFLAVRVNRAITETWEKMLGEGRALQPPERRTMEGNARNGVGKVIVLIPVTGAPWGRPLRPNEYVEVIWTVDAGRRDQTLKDLKGEVGLRRARILRLCAEANVQGGDPREEDLARVLDVTTRTIRSDIACLRSEGCHVQTRGGNLH